MTVRVLMFASLAQRMGARELALGLAEGATVADAMRELSSRTPSFAQVEPTIAAAVNMEYVPRTRPLRDGDELALIPPVSGG